MKPKPHPGATCVIVESQLSSFPSQYQLSAMWMAVLGVQPSLSFRWLQLQLTSACNHMTDPRWRLCSQALPKFLTRVPPLDSCGPKKIIFMPISFRVVYYIAIVTKIIPSGFVTPSLSPSILLSVNSILPSSQHFFCWSIVDLQCFRCTAKWFSYIYTYIYILCIIYIYSFSDSFPL